MFALYFFISLFTFLWSLLFVVPGVVAAYRYAMAPYLMLQNPHLAPLDAIRQSGRLMYGRKGDLFYLHLTFIGWVLGALYLTFGVGMLWVAPYMEASMATFYLDITGQLPRPVWPGYPPYSGGYSPPPNGYPPSGSSPGAGTPPGQGGWQQPGQPPQGAGWYTPTQPPAYPPTQPPTNPPGQNPPGNGTSPPPGY